MSDRRVHASAGSRPRHRSDPGDRCALVSCAAPLRGRRSPFCGPACRIAFHNRRRLLGAAVLDMACLWRRRRGRGDLARLSRMVDRVLAEDRAAGVGRYREPEPWLTARPDRA